MPADRLWYRAVGGLVAAVTAAGLDPLAGSLLLYPVLRPPRQHHTMVLVGMAVVLAPVSLVMGMPTVGRLLAIGATWLTASMVFLRYSVRYHRQKDADPTSTGVLLSIVFTGIPIGGIFLLMGQHAGTCWMSGIGIVLIAVGLLVTERVRAVVEAATDSTSE